MNWGSAWWVELLCKLQKMIINKRYCGTQSNAGSILLLCFSWYQGSIGRSASKAPRLNSQMYFPFWAKPSAKTKSLLAYSPRSIACYLSVIFLACSIKWSLDPSLLTKIVSTMFKHYPIPGTLARLLLATMVKDSWTWQLKESRIEEWVEITVGALFFLAFNSSLQFGPR